jgi:hypothetical protein
MTLNANPLTKYGRVSHTSSIKTDKPKNEHVAANDDFPGVGRLIAGCRGWDAGFRVLDECNDYR